MSLKIAKCLVLIQKNSDNQYAVKDDVYEFSEVKNISTEESYELPINTAFVTVPKAIDFLDQTGQPRDANEIFAIGDLIKIIMWYQRTETDNVSDTDYTSYNRKAIFTGYVAEIEAGNDIKIKCEDEMWAFKQYFTNLPGQLNETNSAFEDQIQQLFEYDPNQVSLSNVVNTFTNVVKIKSVDSLKKSVYANTKIVDIGLGKFKIENASFVQVLNELQKTYNVISYFRNQQLYVGTFASVEGFQRKIQFTFGIDILDDKNLKFQDKENILIKIDVTAIYPNDVVKKLQQTQTGINLITMQKSTKNGQQNLEKKEYNSYFIGDENGSLRTFFLYFTQENDEKDLETMLEAGLNELNKYKYTGWKGSFETFGEAVIYPGDTIDLFDARLTKNQTQLTNPVEIERNGEYLVRSVKRIFDASSPKFHQIIELGPKIET